MKHEKTAITEDQPVSNAGIKTPVGVVWPMNRFLVGTTLPFNASIIRGFREAKTNKRSNTRKAA